MQYWLTFIAALGSVLVGQPGVAQSSPEVPGVFRQVDAQAMPNVFMWTDTCNVYVLREGNVALLIDLGDGSVLEHLAEIGVKEVEWVLFTHHHREQCQGAPRLKGRGIRIGAPEAERAFFEAPSDFRKMDVRLGDAFTIHGASYVRPPIEPVSLDRTFRADETFTWRGREIRCLETSGNSPGSMTYLLQQDNRRLAFSGDVMLEGAQMHTWFDTEWDYGFAAGIHALQKSVASLAGQKIAWMLPSHGSPISEPTPQLHTFEEKLRRLERLYVRGYPVHDSVAIQDKVSQPTVIPDVVQVSPHLFKFKRPNFWPNFGLILADSGHALVVDCGLLETPFLDQALAGLREHFGLRAIDAIVITHMHGDHFLQAPHVRDTWGAGIWALDRMVDKMEHPEWFDYAAPIQAYGMKNADGSAMTGVRVDRALRSGDTIAWEGYQFTVDWMPGQTEFALCLHGQIDGRHVAFTGDNIFGDPEDPQQTGHEAVVAHNSGILEEGYLYGAQYLTQLQPDLLVGGHSYVMDRPAQFIERYRNWAVEMRTAFQALSPDNDYRYWFDPFWVRAQPYRITLRPGEWADVSLHVRNFRSAEQSHRIEVHPPADLSSEPSVLEGVIAATSRQEFTIRLQAAATAAPGIHIVAFDVTLDDRRYGEWFDLIVNVDPTAPGS
ncbi:MAG: MBL fold metallo-hydrolase [Pirellulaceae bacterium]